MRRRLIVFCAVLLAVTNLFCVNRTVAWFTSGGDIGKGTFDSGQVLYEPGGKFIDTAFTIDQNGSEVATGKRIVPGSALVDSPLTLTNKSNVNTKLKVEISYAFRQRPGDSSSEAASNEPVPSESYPKEMTDLFLFVMDENWKQTENPEEVDNKDRKRVYYYGTTSQQMLENQGKVITPEELTQAFPVISSMKLSESYGGFQLDEQLLITVRFYARQDDHLDKWSTIVDYSIGV